MKTNESPQMRKVGCLIGTVYIGAFISGIYQGVYESKGIIIDPNTKTLIKYGPIVLGGLLGLRMSSVAKNDGSIEDLLNEATEKSSVTKPMNNYKKEIVKNNMRGYVPALYPFVTTATTAGIEAAGYLIGRQIGNI